MRNKVAEGLEILVSTGVNVGYESEPNGICASKLLVPMC